MSEAPRTRLLKPTHDVGIVGYGAYIPQYRLPAREIARVWAGGGGGLPIKEKAVAGLDEDVVTMSIEAARNALARAEIDPTEIRAVWVGSESHPYAVKPTSTIVAESIGATPHTQAADWEFACKAGTEALQAAIGFVGSGMARYALAIGMDIAQGRPGDALEYTAAAGGAAYLLGPAEESVAAFEGSYSYSTDTPDFWRRAHEIYPEHGERFTGEFPPTLEEVIDLVRGRMRINIELKYNVPDPGLAPAVVDLLRRKDFLDEVVITSLDYAALKQVESLEPRLRTGHIVTAAVGNVVRTEADFLSLNAAQATPSLIRRAHAAGKEVHVWTVNEPELMLRMIERGVDNVITDDPALLVRVMQGRRELTRAEILGLRLRVLFSRAPRALTDPTAVEAL